VLVTGPTGSGKTTTLYSTLKHWPRPKSTSAPSRTRSRWSSRQFNQMQVQSANIDLNFAEARTGLMRQDPDIIMVGEIRDLETAEMAIQAALTGHLVLSTLHTNDAPSRSRACSTSASPHTCSTRPSRRHGAAPGAHAVPALQGEGASSVIAPRTSTGRSWSRRGSPPSRPA
jgi:hypothetical protein